MNIKIIKQIDVQEWDKLVRKTYNKNYSLQQQEGCKSRGVEVITTDIIVEEYDYENDTIPEVINGDEMGVSFKAWLEKDPNAPLNPSKEELYCCNYYWGKTPQEEEEWKKDKSNIDLFWIRNFYPDPNVIAVDLCKRGLLEPGEYQIKIDW